MNELIKFTTHKQKKYYNLLDSNMKNDLIVSEIMYDMVDNVLISMENGKHDSENYKINNHDAKSNLDASNNTFLQELAKQDPPECRICFEEEKEYDPFVWPCRCKGTSKYVHKSCLDQWRYGNIDAPAFEICMECSYKYRFRHEYPYEFHSRITINSCFVGTIINIVPFVFSYILKELDKMNNLIILKFFILNNPTIIDYSKQSPGDFNTVSYTTYYNLILFVQDILLMGAYLMYICKTVYRKKEFFNLAKRNIPLYFFILFKFPILFNIRIDNLSVLSYFVTLSTLYIFFEPILYIVLIKKHNNYLLTIDLNNQFLLENYEENNDVIEIRSIDTDNVSEEYVYDEDGDYVYDEETGQYVYDGEGGNEEGRDIVEEEGRDIVEEEGRDIVEEEGRDIVEEEGRENIEYV